MKAIASSIRQFDQGNAVSNLQQALTSLGFLISNDEQIASFFGDTTSNALRRFQESFQISVTDRVDENTAKTLNEVLKHKQLLDKDFRVSGHVLDALGKPVVQASVVAFDVDLRGILLINKVTSIRETMQMPGFQWIGSAATNNEGYYQIEFDAESFIFGDKSHADTICFLTLEDKIIAHSNLAVKSDYIGNAIENLDIRLATGDLIKGISEYEALINTVAPILRMSDLSLTDIANSLEQINFLAQETDIDSSKILLAAQAESLLFGRTELSGTDYLYALGRENIGLMHGEIIDFTQDVLVEKITAAIAKNIIQTKSEESIHDFIKRLLRLAASLIVLDTSKAPKTV